MAEFARILGVLEKQQQETERMVAHYQACIEQLLVDQRRTLVEQRRTLEGTHGRAHHEGRCHRHGALPPHALPPHALPPAQQPPAQPQVPLSHQSLLSDFTESEYSLSASSASADVDGSSRDHVRRAKDFRRNSTKEIVPHNSLQECLLPIVHSMPFQAIVMSLVLLSAVMMAIDVDLNMKAVISQKPSTWTSVIVWAQTWCTVAFTVEIVLRMLAEQRDFLCGQNRKWNIFETVILVTNILDVVSTHQAGGGGGFNAIRCVRIVRCFRAVRVIRVFRFLRQIRLMVFTIIASFSAFVWAIVLMLLMVFVSAIYLEDMALDYMKYNRKDAVAVAEFKESWGSMYHAILSMIYSISGGKDWGDLANPFVRVSAIHGTVYTGIVLFMLFGFFNVVVGVFVNETAGIDHLDPELVIHNSIKKKEALCESLRKIFYEIDEDGNGQLTLQELRASLQTERICEELKHYEIDVAPEEADTFINLMDNNMDGIANIDEFVGGCLKLVGNAKPMALAILTRRQNEVQHKLDFLISVACERRDAAAHATAPRQYSMP